ncbi:MAG: hypothetical protein MUP21_02080 [Dehalococcoidia bacterium]|nr:hypothetical protein [Dehalococcoidia bacterium]
MGITDEPIGLLLVATILCIIILATAVTIGLGVFKNRPRRTYADIPPAIVYPEDIPSPDENYRYELQARIQETRLQFTQDLMSMREDFVEYERRMRALVLEQSSRLEPLTLALTNVTKNMAGLERECSDAIRCMNALIAEVRSASTKTQALSDEVERQRRPPFRT